MAATYQAKACIINASRGCGAMCLLDAFMSTIAFSTILRKTYFNINNEIHMFCLSYVFTPRISQHLRKFTEGWDNHPLSTERNLTPNQLWFYGLHKVNQESNVSQEVWLQPEPTDEVRRTLPFRVLQDSEKFYMHLLNALKFKYTLPYKCALAHLTAITLCIYTPIGNYITH